jgi:hypothetical protein
VNRERLAICHRLQRGVASRHGRARRCRISGIPRQSPLPRHSIARAHEGKDAKFIRTFDAFRKKRNISNYDIGGGISDREVEEMIASRPPYARRWNTGFVPITPLSRKSEDPPMSPISRMEGTPQVKRTWNGADFEEHA